MPEQSVASVSAVGREALAVRLDDSVAVAILDQDASLEALVGRLDRLAVVLDQDALVAAANLDQDALVVAATLDQADLEMEAILDQADLEMEVVLDQDAAGPESGARFPAEAGLEVLLSLEVDHLLAILDQDVAADQADLDQDVAADWADLDQACRRVRRGPRCNTRLKRELMP